MSSIIFFCSYIALWVLVLFETLVLVVLVRQLGSQQTKVTSETKEVSETLLATGSKAPEFQASEVLTRNIVKSNTLRGHYLLLVFISPYCSTCEAIVGDLESFRAKLNARLLVVCSGAKKESSSFVEKHLPKTQVILDHDGSISRNFKISGTPMAVLLDSEWSIVRYGFHSSDPQRGNPELKLKEQGEAQPENTILGFASINKGLGEV